MARGRTVSQPPSPAHGPPAIRLDDSVATGGVKALGDRRPSSGSRWIGISFLTQSRVHLRKTRSGPPEGCPEASGGACGPRGLDRGSSPSGGSDSGSGRRASRVSRLGREVTEDRVDHLGLGDNGDDPHGLPTPLADQWVNLIDTSNQGSPHPTEGARACIGGRGVLPCDPGLAILLSGPPPGAHYAGVSPVVPHCVSPRLEDVHPGCEPAAPWRRSRPHRRPVTAS